MLRWIKSKLSMKRRHCLFIDQVSHKEVFLYTDCFGDKWMANFNHWFFRVKRSDRQSEGGGE